MFMFKKEEKKKEIPFQKWGFTIFIKTDLK